MESFLYGSLCLEHFIGILSFNFTAIMTYILQISKPGKQRGQGTCPNTPLLSDRENQVLNPTQQSAFALIMTLRCCAFSAADSFLQNCSLSVFLLIVAIMICLKCKSDVPISWLLILQQLPFHIRWNSWKPRAAEPCKLPLCLSLQLFLSPPNSFYSSTSKDLLFSERDIPFHASRWHTYYSLFTEYLSSSIFHIFPIQTAVHSLYSSLNRASPQLRKLVS